MVSVYGAMTDERKERIWQLWRQGRPMIDIARDIVKPPATVYSHLLYHGGIEPRKRIRRAASLSLEERKTIYRALVSGGSIRSIAQEIARSPSTVCREIAHNGGGQRYRACNAETAFLKRSRRPKSLLLSKNLALRSIVTEKLEVDWSPEKISGWLKILYPREKQMYVSHETIYKSLFIQTRGALSEEVKKHLRTKRMFRHAKSHKTAYGGHIVDAISIRQWPAQVEARAILGHWEGDLIMGFNNSAIATVVERRSRFTVLCKVKNNTTIAVMHSLTQQMKMLPLQVLKSLTWDRGQELSTHKAFTMATDMVVYFFDPSSPWQLGTNENTNGLLRQYFPKRTGLAMYSQKQLDSIAEKLNSLSRKNLGFKAPSQVFNEALR